MVMLKQVSHKSAGLIIFKDYHTGEVLFEGEVRQCIHCQNTWTHKPGSGIQRGFCMRCNGHLCGHYQCSVCYHKEKRIEDMEAHGRAVIEAAVRRQELRERIHSSISLKEKR